MKRRTAFAAAWGLLCLSVHAQAPQAMTLTEHKQRLAVLQSLAEACRDDAGKCLPERVGPDESLTLSNGVQSEVHYEWLRQALKDAKDEKPEDRKEDMQDVATRLQAPAQPGSPVAPAEARRQADAVLREVEFAAAKPSWLVRQWDRLMDWLGSHLQFGGTDGSARFWIRLFLELLLFAIPLTLLGLWLARQIREDRMVPELSRERATRGQAAKMDWTSEAGRAAAAGDWRAAIHALYWQTITSFEDRHVWSVSRNRTPREYLALLQPGSRERLLLREKTAMLEMVWYGHREATEGDYRRVAQLTEELARA